MNSKAKYQRVCRFQITEAFYDPYDKKMIYTASDDAVGKLYDIDEKTHILAYDTELAGVKITTTIKLCNGIISKVNIGGVHSRSTYAPKQPYACQYFFGGMSMILSNDPEHVHYQIKDYEGQINVRTKLKSGETYLGTLEFVIHIKG